MPNTANTYRVLIVDDEETDRRTYDKLLAEQEAYLCDVQHAVDGATGLAALRATEFDCVLLDFNLPDMNGLEFMRVAASGGALNCAVVLMTGQGSEALAVQAMKCGVQDYLVKSQVNASSLWRAMTTAVTATELRQRLTRSLKEVTVAKQALERSNAKLQVLAADLLQARDVAEQANQAKSRFLATVTHDLRTPLHGILGNAELLCLEGGLNPTQTGRLDVMTAAGQHLLDMIDAVLDLSQIEADRMQLQPVEFDLPDLVRGCLDIVRPAAEAKGLALGLVEAPPLRLFADRMRLRQVLLNLLGNAVKFTPAGRVEVRIPLADDKPLVRVEVADSGPGIPGEKRGQLFRPFERLDRDALSAVEGSGLGLAITARLMQAMGGWTGYADNPGGGSVFWFELPAINAAPVTVSPAVPLLVGRKPALRALVVDDEALNRTIAREFLTLGGHTAVCVDCGAAAVAVAAGEDFDVILMDVQMPVMNGLEAARRIRQIEGPRGKVPVLAVTAQAFAQQIAMCREAGMDGHVSKPFSQAVLLAAIRDTAHRDAGDGDAGRGGAGAGEASDRDPGARDASGVDADDVDACDRAGAGLETTPGGAGQRDTTQRGADSVMGRPISGPAGPQAALPVFDRTAFEDMTDLLSAAELAENLTILDSRCGTALRMLRMPDLLARSGELGALAHKLAGGAGTFGFMYVAAAARRFEHASEQEPGETVAAAQHLAAAIERSMPILSQELAAAS